MKFKPPLHSFLDVAVSALLAAQLAQAAVGNGAVIAPDAGSEKVRPFPGGDRTVSRHPELIRFSRQPARVAGAIRRKATVSGTNTAATLADSGHRLST
jgi:hypothetical protein